LKAEDNGIPSHPCLFVQTPSIPEEALASKASSSSIISGGDLELVDEDLFILSPKTQQTAGSTGSSSNLGTTAKTPRDSIAKVSQVGRTLPEAASASNARGYDAYR
jgi:hypothetical protein